MIDMWSSSQPALRVARVVRRVARGDDVVVELLPDRLESSVICANVYGAPSKCPTISVPFVSDCTRSSRSKPSSFTSCAHRDMPVVDQLAAVLGDLSVRERSADRPAPAAEAVGRLMQRRGIAGLLEPVGAVRPASPPPTTTIFGASTRVAARAVRATALAPTAAAPKAAPRPSSCRRVVRTSSRFETASSIRAASGVRDIRRLPGVVSREHAWFLRRFQGCKVASWRRRPRSTTGPCSAWRTTISGSISRAWARTRTSDVPIIVRGDGCYLEDINGKRYLDALAGLFAVQIGYGFGEEVGQAALDQMRELPFYTNWSYAHPRAIELAAEIASLAPGDLNRVFFVSGGSEAVESAWKLARQYHLARGERRWKVIARRTAYHGTTMGALSINGITALRTPYEPLVPDVVHVRNTNRFHRPAAETEEQFTALLLEEMDEAIVQAGPETVAMVILEPVQNAGGSFTPPAGYFAGVRALCDTYGILLCADEVITGFGRVGAWFGSERYDVRPDLVTSAKGLSSAYAAIGAVIARDEVMEPFLSGKQSFAHGITFGGHPVMAASR